MAIKKLNPILDHFTIYSCWGQAFCHTVYNLWIKRICCKNHFSKLEHSRRFMGPDISFTFILSHIKLNIFRAHIHKKSVEIILSPCHQQYFSDSNDPPMSQISAELAKAGNYTFVFFKTEGEQQYIQAGSASLHIHPTDFWQGLFLITWSLIFNTLFFRMVQLTSRTSPTCTYRQINFFR